MNINKIESLFRTGFFHIFGSSVINKIIAFLSSIVLVRILTKSEYGVFTYSWNIYSILLLFNGLAMDSSALQLSSEKSTDDKYRKKIFDYGTRGGLLFNLFLGIIILFIALKAPLKINGAREILMLLFLLPIIHFLFNMSSAFLRSKKMNKEFSTLNTLNTSLLFIFSLCFSFLFKEKGLVFGYYLSYGISVIFGCLFYKIRLIDNKRQKDYQLSKDDKKGLMSISLVSTCNNGLSQLLYLLDVFILGIVLPNEMILASYKVATTIPTALTFIPSCLVIYIYPYFAERKDNGKWCLRRYKQILLGLGAFNFLLSFILFLFAPFIVNTFFGTQYSDSVIIFRILMINYFISGTFRVLSGNLLVTQRKLKFNLFVAIFSGIVNIIGDYFFIQWWGSVGAALATLLVVIVSSILSTSYLIYTFKQRIENE